MKLKCARCNWTLIVHRHAVSDDAYALCPCGHYTPVAPAPVYERLSPTWPFVRT